MEYPGTIDESSFKVYGATRTGVTVESADLGTAQACCNGNDILLEDSINIRGSWNDVIDLTQGISNFTLQGPYTGTLSVDASAAESVDISANAFCLQVV